MARELRQQILDETFLDPDNEETFLDLHSEKPISHDTRVAYVPRKKSSVPSQNRYQIKTPNIEKWAQKLASIHPIVDEDIGYVLDQWKARCEDGMERIWDLMRERYMESLDRTSQDEWERPKKEAYAYFLFSWIHQRIPHFPGGKPTRCLLDLDFVFTCMRSFGSASAVHPAQSQSRQQTYHQRIHPLQPSDGGYLGTSTILSRCSSNAGPCDRDQKPHLFLVSGTYQSLFTAVLRISSIRRSIVVNLTTRFRSSIGSGRHHHHSDKHQKPFADDVLRESHSYHGSSLPEIIQQIQIMSLGYRDLVRRCPLLDTLLLY